MDFAQPDIIVPRFVSSCSRFTSAVEVGSNPMTFATASWPAASLALFIPMVLPYQFTVNRAWIVNGGTVTKNFDIGVYTSDGAKIFSTGATAQAGASAVQYVTVSPAVVLTPGRYYLAITMDGTNGTAFRFAQSVINMRWAGCLQQASVSTLPASATFAAIANAFWPLFGLTSTTTGF